MKFTSVLSVLSVLFFLSNGVNAKTIPGQAVMDIEFTIPKVEASIYARPYVAIWIEDKQRQPVRTIQLWVGEDEWLKDLRSWWRKVGRNDRTVVDAVTSATRPIGQYRFAWDGLDQKGKRVEQGDYTFYVEVVREHGGRNYLRQKIQLAEQDFKLTLQPTEETGLINLHYHIQ
ncbi:MAG: DUF2271 domain-containing protein [Psychromonas sp.]